MERLAGKPREQNHGEKIEKNLQDIGRVRTLTGRESSFVVHFDLADPEPFPARHNRNVTMHIAEHIDMFEDDSLVCLQTAIEIMNSNTRTLRSNAIVKT